MELRLDLGSFARAVERLAEAVAQQARFPEDPMYPDATIQRFEFTYELSHKMLKRFLRMTSASPELVDRFEFQDLVREGSSQGLLRSGWDRWKDYRMARGTTSHTYSERKAAEVLRIVPDFLEEARHLLRELQARVQPKP